MEVCNLILIDDLKNVKEKIFALIEPMMPDNYPVMSLVI